MNRPDADRPGHGGGPAPEQSLHRARASTRGRGGVASAGVAVPGPVGSALTGYVKCEPPLTPAVTGFNTLHNFNYTPLPCYRILEMSAFSTLEMSSSVCSGSLGIRAIPTRGQRHARERPDCYSSGCRRVLRRWR